MALATSTSSVSYAGNGSTSTLYPIPFVFFQPSDVKVTVVDPSGNGTQLTNSQYTVTGGGFNSTGNVSTATAYGASYTVVISRSVTYSQTTSLTTGDEFPAASMEQALDNVVMQTQQLSRVALPDTAATTGTAPYVLGVNAAGGTPKWVSQSSSAIGVGSIAPSQLSTGAPTWDTSGNLTAASFIGPVTGGVTGNVTGNLAGNVTGPGNSSFAGNLGIGTTNPGSGGGGTTVQIYGASAASMRINNANVAYDVFAVGNDVYQQTSSATGAMRFRTGTTTTERFTVNADGTMNAQGNPINNCKTTAKAWVNFDGTLATPITPRSNHNVSSITKNGTGDYTVTFTASLPGGADYSISGTVGCSTATSGTGSAVGVVLPADLTTARTAASFRVCTGYVTPSLGTNRGNADYATVNLQVFGT